MRHWDEIVALKQRIGIDDTFRPVILHPLRPEVMTEKHRIIDITFEKFHLKDRSQETGVRSQEHDSIDAKLQQQITTSMRMDLFYQTAECQLVPDGDDVRVVIVAGNRKSVQFHAGFRFDSEEYAAVQLGLDIPLKTAIPMNTEITLRLGKRMRARGELTAHPRSFTRPKLNFTFYRNDIDVYVEGDRDWNIRYNQTQAELTPINFDLRHFNLQLGVRWDYMNYRMGLYELPQQARFGNNDPGGA